MPTAPLVPCLGPSCRALVPSGRCATCAAKHEQVRANVEVRRWYRTARWRALRRQKFAENPLCVDCLAEGKTVVWTDLDHEVPHRGDPDRFWDPDNLRGRCHPHHSRKTQRGQ